MTLKQDLSISPCGTAPSGVVKMYLCFQWYIKFIVYFIFLLHSRYCDSSFRAFLLFYQSVSKASFFFCLFWCFCTESMLERISGYTLNQPPGVAITVSMRRTISTLQCQATMAVTTEQSTYLHHRLLLILNFNPLCTGMDIMQKVQALC